MTPTLPPGSYSLADGSMFNLLTPDPALVTIDLIAIGLSKTCRYSGQLPGDVFYSVAEHSVLVSRLVPAPLALAGLLHDASEGLGLSDVVSPLKKLLPDYRVFEASVMSAVAQAFGLDPGDFEDRAVKQADRSLLEAEQIQIRNRPAKRPVDDRYAPPADLEAAGLAFRCALPADARRMFLDRYSEITGTSVQVPGAGQKVGDAVSRLRGMVDALLDDMLRAESGRLADDDRFVRNLDALQEGDVSDPELLNSIRARLRRP